MNRTRTIERPTGRDRFNRFADRLASALGSIQAVIASVVIVIVWAATGPVFRFSDGWQLIINTSTTVITFWMVFVIQNSQARDARALHLKLDEIIRATSRARNEFILAETTTEAEFGLRQRELQDLATEHAGRPAGPTGATNGPARRKSNPGHPRTALAKGRPANPLEARRARSRPLE